MPNRGSHGDGNDDVTWKHVAIKNDGVLRELRQLYGSADGWAKEFEYRYNRGAEVMVETHRCVNRRRGLRFGRVKVMRPVPMTWEEWQRDYKNKGKH